LPHARDTGIDRHPKRFPKPARPRANAIPHPGVWKIAAANKSPGFMKTALAFLLVLSLATTAWAGGRQKGKAVAQKSTAARTAQPRRIITDVEIRRRSEVTRHQIQSLGGKVKRVGPGC